MSKPIVIIGSINMDLVCKTPHIPAAGETILGTNFQQIPGGKGANQAVAAARLTAGHNPVHMIGRVGADAFGETIRCGLQKNGVDISNVQVTADVASGCALIQVDAHGENAITVIPGANARLSIADIDAARQLIASAACVVMQLEIPLNVVAHAIQLCRDLQVHTILDPAPVPADGLPPELLAVDCITPNQTEAAALVRHGRDPKSVAENLRSMGAKAVVLKLGVDGSLMCNDRGITSAAAFPVDVVDTTAAGDAFTAALAVAHAEAMSDRFTLRFANAAGAISCKIFGAQLSLPTRAAVDRLAV